MYAINIIRRVDELRPNSVSGMQDDRDRVKHARSL